MATGNVTVNTAADYIPERWMDPIPDYAERALGIRRRILNAYDLAIDPPDVVRKGDILHVPRIAEETAATKLADTAVTFTTFTDAKTDVTIDQYSYVAKRGEDIATIQSNPELLDMYVRALVYGVEKAIERYVAVTLLQAATGHDVGLTTDNQLTAAEFRTAEQNLMDEGYSVDFWKGMSELFFYSNPAIHQYLKGLGTFTDYDKTGIAPGAATTGIMQVVYGVPVVVSTDWESAGTTGMEEATLFHRSAVLLAVQKEPTIELGRNLQQQADEIVYSTVYGGSLSWGGAADSTLTAANFNSP